LNDNQHKNKLPKDWKWVKLGEIADKISLNKIKIKQKDYLSEGTYPVVDQGQDLIGGFYNDKNLLIPYKPPYVIFGDHTKIKKYINFNFIAGADGVKVLKAKEIIDSKFLYYSLFTVKIEDKGYARHFQLLEKELFPLPPLTTQQAIVAKIEELFSELDKGIEQLKTAELQLKTYRQSVLKWAFEGKLTTYRIDNFSKVVNSNEQDLIQKEILQSSNSENSASDKGELPKGWKWVKLGAIAKKKSLKALPKDYPDAKFIGMDCIEPHTLKPFFLYDFKEFKSAGNVFKTNQVLYGRMRPYLNKVYKAEFDGTCSGEFIILDCENNYSPDLLKYVLHSKDFVSFANRITTGDRPRISYEEISDYNIPLAPIEEQHQVVQAIESRLSVADKLEESITQSLQQSEALRQSILKKAFEGRLV